MTTMFHRVETMRAQSLRRACVAFAALLTLGLFFVFSSATVRGQEDVGDMFSDLEAPAAAPADAGASDDGGAATASSDDGEPVKKQNYLVWMFRSLGVFFTIVFSLLSLAMVALIVMNIVALRRSVIIPEPLTRSFGELLDEKRYQEAYELAKDDDSLLGRVLSTGLARIPTGFEKATQAMQDVEQEEAMRLEHQLGYLALIGNLAPMIGLFGTVVGMIASFQAIASGGAAPSPQKLAEGIATALFTTELGLAIALPALAAFDVLKNRLARFILDVSVVSDNFMGRFSNVGAQPKH